MNPFDTHQVFNQAEPFENVNLFACDPALQQALRREGGGAAWAALLLRDAPACVADAFVRSRLVCEVGGAYGRLEPAVDCAAILARALTID